jgi:hypothetical protein
VIISVRCHLSTRFFIIGLKIWLGFVNNANASCGKGL